MKRIGILLTLIVLTISLFARSVRANSQEEIDWQKVSGSLSYRTK